MTNPNELDQFDLLYVSHNIFESSTYKEIPCVFESNVQEEWYV